MTDDSLFLIDIDKILRTKAPKHYKYIPKFIVSYLKKIVPFGGGIQFNVSKDFAVRYQYLWYFTSSDAHDIVSDKDGRNDIFGQHMASIIFSFCNVDRKKVFKPYPTKRFISF